MNCRRETVEKDVPPGNRPAVPRDSEAYLNGTSQGPTPEDARLPAGRAYSSERRTVISAVAVTPRRDEISRLDFL
jgi:hypothetical protein